MKNISALIGWLLLLAGLAIYVWGIADAVILSLHADTANPNPLKIPEALETITTSIGAILLTNLGVVLGISVTQPTSALSGLTFVTTAQVPNPANQRETIQVIVVLIYVLSLIVCGIVWAITGFETDNSKVAVLVTQSAKTLLGVISAYIAFVLAKQ